MLTPQPAGVWQTTGVGDHLHFLVHVPAVGGDARGLVVDDQAALQTRVVCGHAGGAGIGVAAQSLDAAQCEHEAACRIHEIGTGSERPGDAGRSHQLAGGDHPYAISQTARDQRVDDQRQRFVDRQGHVIGERLRRCATAALATIDGQKVRRRLQAAPRDRCCEIPQELIAANGRLDANRLARQRPHMLDEVQ
jgi:hypothetical protein